MSNSGRSLRICLVSAAYRPYPSGVSEHVHHLAEALRDSGQDVSVLTTSFPGLEEYQPSFPVTRFGRAVLIPVNRSFTTVPVGLRLPGQVKRYLSEGGFDVVHCHGVFPPETAYWAVHYSTAPVVVTFHTYRSRNPALAAACFRLLFRGLNRRISARIAVSRAGRSWASKWLPGDYHIIANGVDTSRFSPTATPDPVFDGQGPTVLYVGRLDERKGLPTLVEAFPAVVAELPGARLVVAGAGPLEDRVRRRCAALGIDKAVTLPGRVAAERLPGFYSGCSVYCSPALGGEAMGIVLIEAMAAGRPVVCSNIAGYDEVVTDGQNGILFPPGDSAALAAALLRVLRSDELSRGLAARALVHAADFAWPRIARQIEQVYHEVMT